MANTPWRLAVIRTRPPLSRMSRRLPGTQPNALITTVSATRPLQSTVANPYTVERPREDASRASGNTRCAVPGVGARPPPTPGAAAGGTTGDTTDEARITPTPDLSGASRRPL